MPSEDRYALVPVICVLNTESALTVGSFVMFDPPFLTYIKSARDHNSIMAKRYGGYWKYEELADHYKKTIKEANNHRQKAIDAGQHDSWIVAFVDGRRYTLEELINIDFLAKAIN